MNRLALLCLAVCLPSLAWAQEIPNPDADPMKLVTEFVSAAQSHNYLLLVPLALVGLVWLARRFLGKWVPFLLTDRGGALLSLVSAVAAAIYAATLAPGPHTVIQVLVAALVTLLSNQMTFGYLKKLVEVTGEDRAQEAAAKAAAAVAGQSPASSVNEAVK